MIFELDGEKMNLLVCVSRVPDTATKIFVGPDGKTIDSKGVKYILNPYDEFALEEAIRLKEKNGGEVTALTVSADDATDILRNALAMGADSAIFIKAPTEPDSYQVAHNIANSVKDKNFDIIFFGRQSVDFDSFQIPSMVAELLNIPSASVVSKLEVNGTKVVAERDIEGGKETVELSLPCAISAQKGLNEPRYPKLPDIMKAKKKPIDEVPFFQVEAAVEVISIALPVNKRVGKILGDSDADINEIVRSLHEDAKVI
jgi:electron transfer flavoprotein beta subunit